MDKLESKILQSLQNDFPLSKNPYEVISKKLGIGCDELFEKVQSLIASGIIRRMGVSLDSRKLGFSSTLAAVSVEADVVEKAAETISRFHEVTHSYLRDGEFNIWFTVIAIDSERIENILEEIRRQLSLESSQVLNLPMKRLFKLNSRFNIKSQ